MLFCLQTFPTRARAAQRFCLIRRDLSHKNGAARGPDARLSDLRPATQHTPHGTDARRRTRQQHPAVHLAIHAAVFRDPGVLIEVVDRVILDLCAAPGSKTILLLSQLIGATGGDGGTGKGLVRLLAAAALWAANTSVGLFWE